AEQDIVHIFPLQQRPVTVLLIREAGSGNNLNPSTNSLPFIRAEAVQARVSQLKFHLPLRHNRSSQFLTSWIRNLTARPCGFGLMGAGKRPERTYRRSVACDS